jgi:hypothetical protein
LLSILAQVWGVTNADELTVPTLIDEIAKAMLDPQLAERVWDGLGERERGALQVLISTESKMPEAKFEQLFGSIRHMGAAAIEREKPHLNPATTAEALYYRGLIGEGFEITETGQRRIIYIPGDLIRVLPAHKTSYDNLPDEDDELPTEAVALDTIDEPEETRPADTSIVDDLTTLLAYLQLHQPLLDGELLSQNDGSMLMPYLLQPDPARLTFMLILGVSADLIEVQNGRALPKRAEARRWLGATRTEQVRRLAEVWRETRLYVDLWHVPGLRVDRQAGTMDQYHPAAARSVVLHTLQHAIPSAGWWSIEDFVGMMREDNADFQRPNSDFDSWYISNDRGEYLTGLASWDAVEGALLQFLIEAPMHWLGLLDLGEDAARLTAYGRAFLGLSAWPNPVETPEKIDVQSEGTLRVSRKVARIDRFQIARFATWGAFSGTYSYRIDPDSIRRAAAQGISVGHIAAFVSRATGDAPLPESLAKLLENWRSGPTATVQIERALILRTTSPETLNTILDNPALRRFTGARLGDMAVIVRADDLRALRDALAEHGIQAEIIGA